MLSRASETDALPRSTWMSQLFDAEPPRLPVPEELRDEYDPALEGQSDLSSPALRAKSMLILSAASKNLLESDFIRLASKGKHVEGWVGGILKGETIATTPATRLYSSICFHPTVSR